jgi:hypothetical protein
MDIRWGEQGRQKYVPDGQYGAGSELPPNYETINDPRPLGRRIIFILMNQKGDCSEDKLGRGCVIHPILLAYAI